MISKIKYSLLFLWMVFAVKNIHAQQIDWEKFLSRNDMIFDRLTTKWEEGVFTGNGLLGEMIYMKDKNSVRIDIGRTDVNDHRNIPKLDVLYTKARLPIGNFILKIDGEITKNTSRLTLWNAEASGIIETTKGKIYWKSIAAEQPNVIIFETKREGGENGFHWDWFGDTSVSPRYKRHPIKDFPLNPEHILNNKKNIQYCLQPMLAGGDYVTAWKTEEVDKNTRRIYITVSYDTAKSSLSQALNVLNKCSEKEYLNILNAHRNWWHQYYKKSFLSLPDARAESFYWAQLYKLASATHSNTLPIDLMGPWFRETPWPVYWFNLNMQLTYSPLYKSNHLELAKPLINYIDKNNKNLIENVPEQYRYNAAGIARAGSYDMVAPLKVYKDSANYKKTQAYQLELGDLTWILYYYWSYYAYSKDEKVLNRLIPILKRSINYYLDVMHKESDGKWHLPPTYSPEYPNGVTGDCNYDLSLFKWGCMTLLNLAPNDKLATTWKDVLQNLAQYPEDENGLRIGRDVPFATSHRHFSHLLMIYPLHLVNWDNLQQRDLIEKSLYRWHSLTGAFQGYSFTGGASIYNLMGKGDSALNYINQLFDHFVKPNTLYLEGGPVIETPLAAAASIQEMVLQNWNGCIRVFPSVPETWKDISFQDMLAEGGFLISAVRKNGETKWIKISSQHNDSCNIITDFKKGFKVKFSNSNEIKTVKSGVCHLSLKKGEYAIIYSDENALKENIAPVSHIDQTDNYWGKKIKRRN